MIYRQCHIVSDFFLCVISVRTREGENIQLFAFI